MALASASVVSRKQPYVSDIVKSSPLMGEGWVGVTSAQASWLVACETRKLRPVNEPRNEDKSPSYWCKEEILLGSNAFRFNSYTVAAAPPPSPSPIEGEGSSWPHGSGPPKKSFLQLKDTALGRSLGPVPCDRFLNTRDLGALPASHQQVRQRQSPLASGMMIEASVNSEWCKSGRPRERSPACASSLMIGT
jgi:hypothetical protein